jgi:DNA primase
MVDTKALLERVDLAALIERDLGDPVRREGRWFKWMCPFHDDRKTPSLGVAGNRWKCFGCGHSGDAIDWLRKREGLSFREACGRLGSIDLVPSSEKAAPHHMPSASVPATAWQEQALDVVSNCQATLWSDAGTKARGWLNRRGLAKDTVRKWRLGFNPRAQKTSGLWVPRGIVIPCLAAGQTWYLKVRLANGQTKYSQVSGGQTALFGADTIGNHSTVVVTEGEFDAMLLHQEAGDTVGVVTLGSAAARLPDAWVPYLLGVQRLLVAYDTDAVGAQGAARWESVSPRAQRIVPLSGKDVTDFYLAGGGLRAWVRCALATDGDPIATPVETQVPISPAPWAGQRVRIEDLPDLKAEYGLRVIGGDPDLDGKPWRPKLYLVETGP